MKATDPFGRYEAETLLESSRGDRFDDTDRWKLVVRDSETGDEVLTRYFGTSHSHATGTSTGREAEQLEFAADGAHLTVRYSDGSVDSYPLPGTGEGTAEHHDGETALRWKIGDRRTDDDGTYQSTKVRLFALETDETLEEFRFGALNKPAIEEVRFSALDGVIVGVSGAEIEIHFSEALAGVEALEPDALSPSGRRALALRHADLGPVESVSLVTVWEPDSGALIDRIIDYKTMARYTEAPPRMVEALFASDTDVWIRYDDGSHRVETLEDVLVADDSGALAANDECFVVVIGDLVRLVDRESSKAKHTVRVTEGRRVKRASVRDFGWWSTAMRLHFDDGGVELHRWDAFAEWGKWMDVKKPPRG